MNSQGLKGRSEHAGRVMIWQVFTSSRQSMDHQIITTKKVDSDWLCKAAEL